MRTMDKPIISRPRPTRIIYLHPRLIYTSPFLFYQNYRPLWSPNVTALSGLMHLKSDRYCSGSTPEMALALASLTTSIAIVLLYHSGFAIIFNAVRLARYNPCDIPFIYEDGGPRRWIGKFPILRKEIMVSPHKARRSLLPKPGYFRALFI